MWRVKEHLLRTIGHGWVYLWLDLLVDTFLIKSMRSFFPLKASSAVQKAAEPLSIQTAALEKEMGGGNCINFSTLEKCFFRQK